MGVLAETTTIALIFSLLRYLSCKSMFYELPQLKTWYLMFVKC